MFRRNHLKSALLAGGRCTGAWVFSGSPAAGEILGLQGFDALVIDQEHTAHGPETTIAQMRAIAAAGPATILVRVPDGESRTIKLALDSGAEGIVVPTVESAEGRAQSLPLAAILQTAGAARITPSRAQRIGAGAQSSICTITQRSC